MKFTFAPERDTGRVALFVDDDEIWSAQGPEYRAPKPSGRIEILSFTTCMIDDLVLSARVSKAWLDKMRAKKGTRGVSDELPPAPTRPVK